MIMNWIMSLAIFAILLLTEIAVSERVTLTRIHVDKSDHATRERRSGHLMPENLFYRMEDKHGLFVMLNLTKIQLPPTTIVKNGQSRKVIASDKDIATYTDFNRDGVFMLRLNRDSQGGIHYDLMGTFQFSKRRVSINPHPIVKDVYIVQDDDGIVDYRGDSILPPGYVRKNKSHRHTRSTVNSNYIIEVCFLADYAIYKKFLTKNSNDEDATQTEMSTHYAFHAEQIRICYKTVQETDPSISISIVNSGLVLYTDPADIPIVENNKVGDTINSSLLIDEFRNYINNIPAGINIPDSDHYMLFTGYDLFDGSSGSLTNAGLAFRDVICTTIAISITEDRLLQRSALTAAHELGHGIGTKHDTDEGCDNADQYIMTGLSHINAITSATVAKRSWTFSNCSVAAFKRSLEGKDCLFNNRYGDGRLSASIKLGQIYSRNDQCRFIIHENSTDFGPSNGNDCFKIRCIVSQEGFNFIIRSVLPLDYSSCEDNTDMWCVRGDCVAKPANEPPANQAPALDNLPTFYDVAENENGVVFTVRSSDPENDPISYSYKWNSPYNAATYFDFNIQTGEVSIKTGVALKYSALQNVVFSLTVTATDGQGGASSSDDLIIRIIQVTTTPEPETTTTEPEEGTTSNIIDGNSDIWLEPWAISAIGTAILVPVLIVIALILVRKNKKAQIDQQKS